MGQAIIGISPSELVAATGIPQYRLGTVGGYDNPTKGYQEFVYGQARGAIGGTGYFCVERTLFDFSHITTTLTAPGTAGHGSRCGVAQAAMADNEYGWFQIFGLSSVFTGASCAAGTRLNTTGTGGLLDDDGTASSEAINGVVLMTATGGANAVNPDTMVTYPTVGVTL